MKIWCFEPKIGTDTVVVYGVNTQIWVCLTQIKENIAYTVFEDV